MLISTIKHQVSELMAELKRVDWPGKPQVKSATLSVVFVSVFAGAFLYVADLVISWGMHGILPHK